MFIEVHGQDHPDVATSYNNIGLVHESLGDFEKALFHHEKALEIRTRAFGQDHRDVASSKENIGLLFKETKRKQEA